MKKAIWFSRHEPTQQQLEEIESAGYELAALEEGKALGGGGYQLPGGPGESR